MTNPMTDTIATRYNADGSIEVSVSDDGPLLYFSAGWPAELTVAPFASVYVEGQDFYAWREGSPTQRAVGGGAIGNRDTGERESIADILRRTLAADDPRWRDSLPAGIFTSAS